MPVDQNKDNLEKAFEVLRKWYSDHKQPLQKKDAFEFSELKKALWQIKSKKASNETKIKEMYHYLQVQKEKHASSLAGFVLSSLKNQGLALNATPTPVTVSPALIQLKQMLIETLPSGPNVVEKSKDGNQVRVHFPSGKLESTYRHAALKDTLAKLKINFTEEKTQGSIPIIVLNEKSVQSIRDWLTFGKTFTDTFMDFINADMNVSITKFQVSEVSKSQQQKSHQDILEAAIAKIKELEQKVTVTGAAFDQRSTSIQHVLAGIAKIKSKKLRENENRIELDKLLNSAGHNIQSAEAVKIMHQVQTELHLKALAKSDQNHRKSNRR